MRRLWLLVMMLTVLALRVWVTKPDYRQGNKVRISGEVLDQPVRYGTSQAFSFTGLKVWLPLFPEVGYGDRIVVEGKVDKGKLTGAKLIKFSESTSVLNSFRNKISDFYDKTLPEPHSSLIAGITFGLKGSLPQSFWNNLKSTGTAHVVVASGTNVTMLASLIISFAVLVFPRRKAIVFVLFTIWGYVGIAGFEAPIVRAGIMGSLTFIAQELGRVVWAWRVLVVTGLIMSIYRPIWITDIGFILSFVATASIMLFERKIRDKLMFLPEFLKEGFSTSLAAQIGVAPIIFVTFGQFNVLSPLINAAILWAVPYIMIFGALGGIIGLGVPVLGKLILYLAYPLTWWFVEVVSIFG